MLWSTEQTLNDQKYINKIMTNTDVILIAIITTLFSGASVWLITRKINQCIPTPHNVLTRSAGDIELGNIPGVIEPTPLEPVHFPPLQEGSGWYSEPINWIESYPIDSITVIEGLNSDHISTIVSPLNSFSPSPMGREEESLFINSIWENENILSNSLWGDYLLISITILIIIIFLLIIITYPFVNFYHLNKPAITFFRNKINVSK